MSELDDIRRKARDEYIRRKSAGEKVTLRKFADELGASYKNILKWKKDDDWDASLPKRKRGGQPGNKNSAGHRNALGSHKGAPVGNKNAEKDGAYSAVTFDALSEEEKAFMANAPVGGREALENEMRILKLRERRILNKIAEYEDAPPDALYVSSMTETRGEHHSEMYCKDSTFTRVIKLQEALYKVQGRIAKIADSIRSIEETEQRLKLERERLDIMRMRAAGVVDVPDIEDEGVDIT